MTSSMESHCISFREIPDTTRLFSSFLYDFQQVASYYAHPPTEVGNRRRSARDSARSGRTQRPGRSSARPESPLRSRRRHRKEYRSPRRGRGRDRHRPAGGPLHRARLHAVQSGLGHRLRRAVDSPRNRCRAGLLARHRGPRSRRSESRNLEHAQRPCRNMTCRQPKADAGKRVGEVRLGQNVDALVAAAAQSLEGGFADDIARALRETYVAGETYGSAFGKLMARLLAGRGIIFIDQLDARLHRLMAPVFQKALDQDEPLRNALLDRSKELEQRDFHAQVKITRETTLLFYTVEGRREPVRSHNGKFSAGKAFFSREELSSLIEKTPAGFQSERSAPPGHSGHAPANGRLHRRTGGNRLHGAGANRLQADPRPHARDSAARELHDRAAAGRESARKIRPRSARFLCRAASICARRWKQDRCPRT